MLESKFENEIRKIQNFLGLNEWKISFRLLDNPGFTGELTNIDYLRFTANLSFDRKLLEETDNEIKEVIMHEFCHIFTIANLRQFEQDEYLKGFIGNLLHAEIITRMNILNEQMTVKLEKVLSEHYKNR